MVKKISLVQCGSTVAEHYDNGQNEWLITAVMMELAEQNCCSTRVRRNRSSIVAIQLVQKKLREKELVKR